MKKGTGILKVGLWFTNLMIVLTGMAAALTVIVEVVILLGGLGALKEVLSSQGVAMTLSQAGLTAGAVLIFTSYFVIAVLLLLNVRRFLKNVLADNIFVVENVQLAKRSAVLLVLMAFLGRVNFFNINYLLTALVVWAVSKVLEKAIAIAEENEFTI